VSFANAKPPTTGISFKQVILTAPNDESLRRIARRLSYLWLKFIAFYIKPFFFNPRWSKFKSDLKNRLFYHLLLS